MLFKDPTLTEIMDEWSNTLFDDEEYEINEIEKVLNSQVKETKKRIPKNERNPVICKKCSHVWKPRTLSPKYCPNCLSIKWNSPKIEKVECNLCGNIWQPRNKQNPRYCPRCLSTVWSKKAYEGYKNFKIENEKIILLHKGGNYEIQIKTLETKEKLLSLTRQLLGKKWVTRKHLWCLVVFCEDKFGYNCYEQQRSDYEK